MIAASPSVVSTDAFTSFYKFGDLTFTHSWLHAIFEEKFRIDCLFLRASRGVKATSRKLSLKGAGDRASK